MAHENSHCEQAAIVFTTGGTTTKSRIIRHAWADFEFACAASTHALQPLFRYYNVKSVANCMTAGNLWGGFIYVQELLRMSPLNCYPLASIIDKKGLVEAVNEFGIDTIIALPSFAVSLAHEVIRSGATMPSLRNIFYFGEGLSEAEEKILETAFGSVQVVPLVFTTQETGPIG